jgi:hypothetical protein
MEETNYISLPVIQMPTRTSKGGTLCSKPSPSTSVFLQCCNEHFDETVTESIYAQCLPLHYLTFESNKEALRYVDEAEK